MLTGNDAPGRSGRLGGEGGGSVAVSSRKAGKHFAVCERIMRTRPDWRVVWGPPVGT
jgi:hypothetical protein